MMAVLMTTAAKYPDRWGAHQLDNVALHARAGVHGWADTWPDVGMQGWTKGASGPIWAQEDRLRQHRA